MASDQQDLETIRAAEKERIDSDTLTKDLVLEMKNSLIFHLRWQDILQAAPVSISAMGALLTASACSDAQTTDLARAGGGLKSLRYESVKANLVECSTLGRQAFIEADKGLGMVQQKGTGLVKRIAETLRYLGDNEAAVQMLPMQVDLLERGARECFTAVSGVDRKFNDWLQYACELHERCVAVKGSDSERALSKKIVEAAVKSKTVDLNAVSRDTVDRMAKQVDLTIETFEAVSGDFSSGTPILPHQLVGDLANCCAGVVAQLIPTIADKLNPAATSSSPLPSNASDGEYTEACRLITIVSALKPVIDGKDGGIDWERAKNDNAIKSLKGLLEIYKSRSSSAASQKAYDALLQIATAIDKEVDKMTNIAYSALSSSSAEVQKWRSDFFAQYEKANAQVAAAQSLPGASSRGIPIYATNVDPEISSMDAKTLQAQAFLDAAKVRLATSKEAALSTQANYREAVKTLTEQQAALSATKARLMECTNKDMSLKEIKIILIENIKLIFLFKNQFSRLAQFFGALTTTIQTIQKTYVQPFVSSLQEAGENIRLANFSILDLQRSSIFGALMTVQAYCKTLADTAAMWMDLSQQNIMPGLRMCDELSILASGGYDEYSAERQMKQKVQNLQGFSEQAGRHIAEVVGEKQEEVLEAMEENVAKIEDTLRLIRAPVAGQGLAAVNEGTRIVREAAQAGLAAEKKESPLSTFAIGIGEIA